MKAILCLVSGLALAVPFSAAHACSSISTARAIGFSDAVIDGDMRCDRGTDECVLRVDKIYKIPGLTRLVPRRIAIKGGYRDMEAMFAADKFNMCSMPFAPQEERFYGRFFLNKDERGRYRVWSYENADRGDGLSEID